MNKHWAFDLIGRPWVRGAEGPDSFNCWGMVRYVQRERFGIAVATVDVDNSSHTAILREFKNNAERDNWIEVKKPKEGDIVELGSAKHPHHVGVWVEVDGGGVLHCVEGVGVVFQDMLSLRIHGWGSFKFSRHRSSM